LSSLPDLKLDQRPVEEELDEAVDLIKRQVQGADLENLHWFFFRNDLYNLIEYWQTEFDQLLERPFRKPYSINRKDYSQLAQHSGVLPNYLQSWYETHQETIRHWKPNRIETELHEVFFKSVEGLEAGFVRDYFLFEKQLRAIIASYHQSRYEFLDGEKKWLEKSLRQTLQRSPLQLSPQIVLETPYLEPLTKALDTKDPSTISLAVHQILWDEADRLTKGHYFDSFALLNYCAKLFLLYRREQLEENQTEARLDVLVQEALSNIKNND